MRERLEELIETRHVVPYFGTELAHIANDHVALKAGKETMHIANDHVIVQIGGTSPSELLKTIGIQLVEKRGVA